MLTDRLVAGMVGGGPGAMIGAAHRHAMWLDNQYVLAAGIFGRDPERPPSSPTASASTRVYDDYREMADRVPARDGVDVVAVVTPNDSHFEIAKAFLEAGISVVCEKPLTNDSTTAAELVAIAESTGAILAVPHIYSAYAMVRHAARMVRDGDLGRIRFVAAEHASGWASAQVDQWRMDPAQRRRRHAPSPTSAPTRFTCCAISPDWKPPASRPSSARSCRVDRCSTTPTIRLTLSNGAPATVWATMAATGHEHGLHIRVFGDDASLEWRHEDPQHLIVRDPDGGTTILAQGMSTLSDDADPPHPRRARATPRDSWRRSPTSTSTWPTCCKRDATDDSRRFATCPSPPASTGSSASGSSKRPSRRIADDAAWVTME